MRQAQILAAVGILAIGFCVTLTTAHAEETAVAKEGEKAPEFKLKGSDGKEYSLKQFAGKQAVVIAWFPKAFTGGCTKECKSMRENGEKIRAFDVAYFTASVDDVEKNTDFAKSLMLDYPILSDPDKTVAQAYGVVSPRGFANRWTFYIDKEGIIRTIDKAVQSRTEQAGSDVAAKIKELGLEAK